MLFGRSQVSAPMHRRRHPTSDGRRLYEQDPILLALNETLRIQNDVERLVPRHFSKLYGHRARYFVAHEDVYACRFTHCPDEAADVYVLVLKLHAFSGQ